MFILCFVGDWKLKGAIGAVFKSKVGEIQQVANSQQLSAAALFGVGALENK